jgi:hypothetical protein
MNVRAVLGDLELKMDKTDIAKSIYSIDELQIERITLFADLRCSI